MTRINSQSDLQQLADYAQSLEDNSHLRAKDDSKTLYTKQNKGTFGARHDQSTKTNQDGMDRRAKFDLAKTIVSDILTKELGVDAAGEILSNVLGGHKTIGHTDAKFDKVEAMTKQDLQDIVQLAKQRAAQSNNELPSINPLAFMSAPHSQQQPSSPPAQLQTLAYNPFQQSAPQPPRIPPHHSLPPVPHKPLPPLPPMAQPTTKNQPSQSKQVALQGSQGQALHPIAQGLVNQFIHKAELDAGYQLDVSERNSLLEELTKQFGNASPANTSGLAARMKARIDQIVGKLAEQVADVSSVDSDASEDAQIENLCRQIFGDDANQVMRDVFDELGLDEDEFDPEDCIELSVVHGKLCVTVSENNLEFSVDFDPQAKVQADLGQISERREELLCNKVCQQSFGMHAGKLKESVAKFMGWDADAIGHMSVESKDFRGQPAFQLSIKEYDNVEVMTAIFMPAAKRRPGVIHLPLAELSQSKQGGGTMVKFFMGMSGIMQKGAFSKASMRANISSGGYAWARYGFQPTREAYMQEPDNDVKYPLSTIVGQMDKFLQADSKLVQISDQDRQRIQALRDELEQVCAGKSDHFGVIRKIADLQIEVTNWKAVFPDKAEDLGNVKGKMKLGKALLMHTDWQADFQLEAAGNRKSDMPYMQAYLMMRAEQDNKLLQRVGKFAKMIGKDVDLDTYKKQYQQLTQES